jgi:TatD DNase family protein
MLVDSHTHLFEIKGYQLPGDIIPVVAGFSHASNLKAARLAKEKGYPFIQGIAPQEAIRQDLSRLEEWMAFIRESGPNAIGEVGLDFKWAQSAEAVEKQRHVFGRMIGLADEMGLPLVIHSRNNPRDDDLPKDAVEEIMGLVRGRRVMMHFFSGKAEQAGRIVAEGGYISVTHLHSKERRKVINSTTLDRLVVESDSPYVGRTPDSIREAITYIAQVKGADAEEVMEKTTENAKRFFGF